MMLSSTTITCKYPFSSYKNKNLSNISLKSSILAIVISISYLALTLTWTPVFIEASFLTKLKAGIGGLGVGHNDERTIPLRMPDIRPDHRDQYLCMAYNAAGDENKQQKWIVGFQPIANASQIHHIILYSCELPGIYQPGEPKFVWDCSGMASAMSYGSSDQLSSFEIGPVCQGKESIIYSWALDAGKLKLPDKVGFEVGTNSQKFLIMQVHYHASNRNHHDSFHHGSHAYSRPSSTENTMPIDNSGLILDVRTKGISRSAGVLLMSSTGYVKPGLSKHEILCQLDDINEDNSATVLHPIYYRTHTHKFGYKVLGGKLIDKRTSNVMDQDEFESSGFGLDLIGERNPQESEMFYPAIRNDMTIDPGDTIYAACYYNQTTSSPIMIGATSDDEMCNFYIMYWTDNPQTVNQKACVSANPLDAYDDNYKIE